MMPGGKIEHVSDREVQRFLLASWVELADENETLRRRNRTMKRAMGALVAITLLTLASAARGSDPADGVQKTPAVKKSAAIPANVPAPTTPAIDAKPLTDAQKLEVREYQLRSVNARQQINELELRARDLAQAQQQNDQQLQMRTDAITKELCAVPQGCTFDYDTLAVRPRPTPPAPQPEKK